MIIYHFSHSGSRVQAALRNQWFYLHNKHCPKPKKILLHITWCMFKAKTKQIHKSLKIVLLLTQVSKLIWIVGKIGVVETLKEEERPIITLSNPPFLTENRTKLCSCILLLPSNTKCPFPCFSFCSKLSLQR